jgi:Rap1a immunity proteins
MKNLLLPSALALLLFGSATAPAAETVMTAGDLQQLCRGSDTTSRNVCRIYILGITQGITIGLSMADGRTGGGRPCIPAQLSGDALETAVKTHLEHDLTARPADADMDAAQFVGSVAVKSFPCRKPG